MRKRTDADNVGFLVADITRLIRSEMDRRITEEGIEVSPADVRTLSHAARCGALRQNLLAERIGVEAMTVSASLDRLEAMGLVERQTDSADRRAKLVHVTAAGEVMLDRIQPIGAALRADVARGIPPDDWRIFLDLLKRVLANLTAAREQARKEGAAA
ncbi:MarR family winged helix-turn-helix transcriptional regulator [Mesorhizobium sp. CN2-181]|uniref:MarR family winged helix-turn-helix transcriptional regulator n=1 Tax=Mesorhizobium yinganensis TaxID=3157707 RepID=UPI0032B78875